MPFPESADQWLKCTSSMPRSAIPRSTSRTPIRSCSCGKAKTGRDDSTGLRYLMSGMLPHVYEHIWLVIFMLYDTRSFDDEIWPFRASHGGFNPKRTTFARLVTT